MFTEFFPSIISNDRSFQNIEFFFSNKGNSELEKGNCILGLTLPIELKIKHNH